MHNISYKKTIRYAAYLMLFSALSSCTLFKSDKLTTTEQLESHLAIYKEWLKTEKEFTGEPDEPPQQKDCLNPETNSYRKKVAFLGFSINSTRDAIDLGAIQSSYPGQLAGTLNTPTLLSRNQTHQTLPSFTGSSLLSSKDSASVIKGISESLDSQFLIAGRIVNTGFQKEQQTLKDWLSLQKFSRKLKRQQIRLFTTEITLYDGISGKKIGSNVYHGESFDIQTLKNKPKAFSKQFIDSNYGKLVTNAVAEQAQWIENTINCLPLRVRIIALDDNGITLSSGIESHIVPGDTFMIMTKSQERQILAKEITDKYLPSGEVVIKQVYPKGAYAEFKPQSPKHRISKGDLVQSLIP